jgi:DNA mismatch repair protein MutL
MSIHQLPQHVVNKIAAGEVVERPASVVKELVENALDADATDVSVSVIDGGKTRLKATDNGSGIATEDLDRVFEQHATSKLHAVEDLESLTSLGFRGEALATIGSVAEVSLAARTAEATHGTLIEVSGGEEQNRRSYPMARAGTEVEVRHLFYNTPARRKFLKKAHTELKHITRLMEELALAHPEVTFEVFSQDRRLVRYEAADRERRVAQVLEQTDKEWLVPVEYYGKDMTVSGFVSHPHWTRANRQGFFVSVNGRPVGQQMVAQAVLKGYDTMLEKGQYPVFALDITLDPSLIDVNIHPRKAEVRFSNEREVFSGVLKAVRSALERHAFHNLSGVTERMSRSTPDGNAAAGKSLSYAGGGSFSGQGIPGMGKSPPASRASAGAKDVKRSETLIDRVREAPTRYQGDPEATSQSEQPQFFTLWNRYLVLTGEDGLYLIDQHAAHEKLLLEAFTEHASQTSVQSLIIPITLSVAGSQAQILASFLEESSVFEVQKEEGTIRVTHIPRVLVDRDLNEVFSWLVERVETEPDSEPVAQMEREVLKEMACKAAVKAGDALKEREVTELVANVFASRTGFTCCHGRPAVVQLTEKELDTLFSRT